MTTSGSIRIDTVLAQVIVCPACKQDLTWTEESAICDRCKKTYAVTDGIPILPPPNDAPTIRAEQIRLKDRGQAIRTIKEHRSIEVGFLRRPLWFYLAYTLVIVFLAARLPAGAAAIGTLLLADWIVFRIRRGVVLRRFESAPVRLRTIADLETIDALYKSIGQTQPTMLDWVMAAGEACGGGRSGAEMTHSFDDERYVEIRREHDAMTLPPQRVVDVGTNDGRSCAQFGIGGEGVLIGIDASALLLQEFRRNLPGHVPLLADGTCLPLRTGSMDFLFCTETLEHLTDPDAAIAEFIRVLRPGGRFVVQSPNAHRIRNLNPFHILTLIIGLADDRITQKKTVHENTWHDAVTYHWDFSIRDYRRMVKGHSVKVLSLTSRGFYVPGSILRGRISHFRAKERILGAIPILRFFGDDLVLIGEKTE